MSESKHEEKTLQQLVEARLAAEAEAERLNQEADQVHEAAVDLELDGKSADARKTEAKAGDLRLKASAQERLAERLDDQIQERAQADLAGVGDRAKEAAAKLDAHREDLAAALVFHYLSLLRVFSAWRFARNVRVPTEAADLFSENLNARNNAGKDLHGLLRFVAENTSGTMLVDLHVTQIPREAYEKILRDVFPEGASFENLKAIGNRTRTLVNHARELNLMAERTSPADLVEAAYARARPASEKDLAAEADAPQTSAEAAETVAGD